MITSSNGFTKKTITQSANSFSNGNKPTVSGNSFSKKELDRGSNGWDGDNLGQGGYGLDSVYGGNPYGVGEYFGGLYHFVGKEGATISH